MFTVRVRHIDGRSEVQNPAPTTFEGAVQDAVRSMRAGGVWQVDVDQRGYVVATLRPPMHGIETEVSAS